MEEVVDFKIIEGCLVSIAVVLQQGTLAVNTLRSGFSRPLFRPSTEVPEVVLEVTWSALTPVGKTGVHRREQRAEIPSGVSVSSCAADTIARAGDAVQPIHQLGAAAAA